MTPEETKQALVVLYENLKALANAVSDLSRRVQELENSKKIVVTK